jgi:hypothetical protein
MFIPAVVFTVLMWLGLGAAGICALLLRVNGFKWQPLAGIAIGLIVGLGPRAMTTHVIVVSDSGGPMDVDQHRMLGSREYRFSDGNTVKLAASKDTIVVNDSQQMLVKKSVRYGSGILARLPSTPEQIEPGTFKEFVGTIDPIGPTDRPPSSVSVSRGSTFTSRDWLTW